MGRSRNAVACLLAAVLAATAGCLPNRAAVSPDGKTFYFSLNGEGGFDANESSRIYALTIETGRLAALTDNSRPAAWCSISSDGRMLAYMTGIEDNDMALFMMRTDTGVFWPLTGILQKHVQPWMIPGTQPRLLAMSRMTMEKPPRWAAYTPDEMNLPLPADAGAGFGNVGLAENRCAVTVYRPGPAVPGAEEVGKGSAAVYVIDFPAGGPDADMPEAMEPPAVSATAPPAKIGATGLNIEVSPNKAGTATLKIGPGAAIATDTTGAPIAKVGPGGSVTGTATFRIEAAQVKAEAPKPAPDPARKNEATVTKVAEWSELKDDQPIIDLAFSPDGKRLVAAMLGCGAQEDDAAFVELDPTGKQAPKPLFDAYKAYYPQFTPDGKGLVYLRTTHENDKIREVVLWRFDAGAKPPVLLARLPGELGKAYTTWYWLPDGRLRIYHVSEEGVRLVETGADGQGAKARLLAHDRLKAGRRLADLQYAMDDRDKLSRVAEEEWDKGYAAQMKAAGAAQDAADKPTKAAIEEAWKSVARWEDIPAIAPIPAAGPDVVMPETPKAVAPAPEKPAATPTATPEAKTKP